MASEDRLSSSNNYRQEKKKYRRGNLAGRSRLNSEAIEPASHACTSSHGAGDSAESKTWGRAIQLNDTHSPAYSSPWSPRARGAPCPPARQGLRRAERDSTGQPCGASPPQLRSHRTGLARMHVAPRARGLRGEQNLGSGDTTE